MPGTPPPSIVAGKPVNPIGYGMMSRFSQHLINIHLAPEINQQLDLTAYGSVPHDEAIKSLKAAIDNGANFWNGVSIS